MSLNKSITNRFSIHKTEQGHRCFCKSLRLPIRKSPFLISAETPALSSGVLKHLSLELKTGGTAIKRRSPSFSRCHSISQRPLRSLCRYIGHIMQMKESC